MRYFFVESSTLQQPAVAIKGSEARHIKNVLRLKAGDRIRLFDGEGFEYEAIIRRLVANRIEIKVIRKFAATKESPLQIVVAQALLRQRKMDRLLRHLCELGIMQWVPFTCERSVPRTGAQHLAARMERWKKIVKESCKQCQRAKLPEIIKTLTYEEVLATAGFGDLKIVFWENEATGLNSLIALSAQPEPQKILLILGPEGGFTDEEIATAKTAGCVIAGLGPRILRAETAAIAACTLIQYLFGDMG